MLFIIIFIHVLYFILLVLIVHPIMISRSRSPSFSRSSSPYSDWLSRSPSRSRSSSPYSSWMTRSPSLSPQQEEENYLPDLNFEDDETYDTRQYRRQHRDDFDDNDRLMVSRPRGRSRSLSSGSVRSSLNRTRSSSCSPALTYTVSHRINYDEDFPPL